MKQSDLKQFFSIFNKAKDVLADAYINGKGLIDEYTIDDKLIAQLVKTRLAWRPGVNDGLRLTREVNDLFSRTLQDQRRISIDPNIGGKLSSIEDLINVYKKLSNASDRELYLDKIEAEISGLMSNIQDATRQLWRLIDDDFGYVSSIEAKILENQRVIKQTVDLVKGLELINRDELYKLANYDANLKRLLISWLADTVTGLLGTVTDASHRLKDMLFNLKEHERTERLVNQLYQKFENDISYRPLQNYSALDVPEQFNRVEALEFKCYPDLDDSNQEIELGALIVGLRKEYAPLEVVVCDPISTDEDVKTVDIIISPLRMKVDEFFAHVIESGNTLNALDYLPENVEDCDEELWLYAVTDGYIALGSKAKKIFDLKSEGVVDEEFDGRFIIHDLIFESLA